MPEERPIREPFEFSRGDTWPAFAFQMKDETGADIPFDGVEILMQVKRKARDEVALKQFTHLSGFVISNGVATLEGGIEEDLEPGTYVHDIQVKLPNGIVKTKYNGPVKIRQDVSR